MKILENTLIKLREPEPEDIDFLYETENVFDYKETGNIMKPVSKYILKQYINNSHSDIYTTKQIKLIIERKKDGKILGLTELFDYDPVNLRAGTGISIVKDERKKGYAEQTLLILIEYCKNILFLNQLYCNILQKNTPSIKLFEKIGFIQTGIKKQWINTPEGFKDVFFYQYFIE